MGTVRAIPEGYGTVTPFLNIKGADAAIELYKQAFGAEEGRRFMMPDGKVALVELKIGTSILRVSESVDVPPSASSFGIYTEDANAAWARATAAGCEVVLPLEDRFFGDRFGILKDPYGNRWAIAQHVRDVSDEEMRSLAPEARRIR